MRYFESCECNIAELFTSWGDSEGEVRYYMPHFQRGYSWKKGHITKLFDDLCGAAHQEEEKMYFLSSIVCFTSDGLDGGDSGAVHVLDGQQRLITLSLLIHALVEQEAVNPTSPLSQCLFLKDGKTPRLRLQNRRDQGAYEFLLTKKPMDSGLSSPVLNAYRLLTKLVRRLDSDEADTLAQYLLEHTFVIKSVLTDSQYASGIFEILNDRGKRLEPYDLIKAKIYLEALNKGNTGSGSEKSPGQELGEELAERIEALENHMNTLRGYLGKQSLSNTMHDLNWLLLQTHYKPAYPYTDWYIPNGDLYLKYQSVPAHLGEEPHPEDYVSRLCDPEHRDCYVCLIHGQYWNNPYVYIQGARFSSKFQYMHDQIKGMRIFQPVLFELLRHFHSHKIAMEEYEERVAELFALARHVSMLEMRPSTYQEHLAEMAYALHDSPRGQVLGNFVHDLDELSKRLYEMLEAKAEWSTGPDRERAHTLLFDICVLADEDPEDAYWEWKRKYELDHILPKDAKAALEGEGFEVAQADHGAYVNNLGNLVIANPALTNISFKERLQQMEGGKEEGEGEDFVYPIARSVKQQDSVKGKDNPTWTKEAIQGRRSALNVFYLDRVGFDS